MVTLIQNFILRHKNWETLLESSPYNLIIKRDNGYILFKYNQLDSDFSCGLVKECRGLILREKDFKLVCFPFTKFFNVNEIYADQIDWDSMKVYEKIDGSLIKVWYDKTWHISTNGAINAFSAEINSNILCPYETYGDLALKALTEQKFDFDNLNKDYTYMFELVSPYTRIVVPYDHVDIYHLGTRDNKTGKELETDIGIKKPKIYKFKDEQEIEKYASILPYDKEGYVVRDKDYHRVKIKSLKYLNVHRLIGNLGLNKKRIFELVRANDYQEFLSYFPECTPGFNKVIEEYKDLQSKLEIIQKNVESHKNMERKEFANWLINTYPGFSDFGFSLYSGKVSNYKEFVERLSNMKILRKMEKRGDITNEYD